MSKFCKFWMSLPSAVLLCACLPSMASAAEVCNPAWEYKVIHTDHAEAAVIRGKASATQAAGEFETRLNRMGANGWELASQHDLIVKKSHDMEQFKGWTVRLEPAAVLFKRRSGCVQ